VAGHNPCDLSILTPRHSTDGRWVVDSYYEDKVLEDITVVDLLGGPRESVSLADDAAGAVEIVHRAIRSWARPSTRRWGGDGQRRDHRGVAPRALVR
jgi:hypothetical protein